MTIKEAIKEVMRQKGAPMTAQEAYEAIIKADLYQFNAAVPSSIVRSEIRKHCIGVDFPTASKKKHFKLVGENEYYFLEQPQIVKSDIKNLSEKRYKKSVSDLGVSEVRVAHEKHKKSFKKAVLRQIRTITPENFEHFTKNLLEVYGFEDVEVTRYSKDGGIDGFGQLKVGFALITVAFQCKRYTSKSVRSKEIQEFRGAIQGKCEQGLFFTTSKFTGDCHKLMFQPGAVPIILIDGESIVDIMIEKEFGIQKDIVPIYFSALDLAISSE